MDAVTTGEAHGHICHAGRFSMQPPSTLAYYDDDTARAQSLMSLATLSSPRTERKTGKRGITQRLVKLSEKLFQARTIVGKASGLLCGGPTLRASDGPHAGLVLDCL